RRRPACLAGRFAPCARVGAEAGSWRFVAGSVLNSRPFRAAITAIRGRPAYREVDRRLVYVDPSPASAGMPARRGMPGFFTTLKGALSDIPPAEPVPGGLSWIRRLHQPALPPPA